MTETTSLISGVTALVCAPGGPPLAGEREALDIIGNAFGLDAQLIVVPRVRLADDFFVLGSGVAGAILQKFANYRLHLVIMGDLAAELAASSALRAYVGEANRGRQIWFVADLPELEQRLAR